jgi:hypothetical protein
MTINHAAISLPPNLQSQLEVLATSFHIGYNFSRQSAGRIP